SSAASTSRRCSTSPSIGASSTTSSSPNVPAPFPRRLRGPSSACRQPRNISVKGALRGHATPGGCMARRLKLDAVALIKQDHRAVEKLFDRFEKARDEERKKALAREICTELTIHAMIEEEIFYPSCQGQIEDEDVLDEAYVEHDGVKVLISEIMSNLNARF